MSRISIAGLQLETVDGDNTDAMEAEIDAVAKRFPWVDMVVLGELNAYGAHRRHAEPLPGPFEKRFSDTAKRNGIWLVPGSIVEQDGDRYFNTAPVINPDGEVVARSRKLFPWYPYENGIAAGTGFTVFDVPGVGRFGVSICYDMWFQETLRALVWEGAEVILHPSLTSTIDRDVEKCMVRASAAMYQCYFFDVNVAGRLGVGNSIVAGPGGEVVYEAQRGRDVFPLKLDLDYLRDVREDGWHGLGQPLKCFRDSTLAYPQYSEGARSEALDSLGKLRLPGTD